MRYLVGFVCVLALGVVPVVGCGESEGDPGGSGGSTGTGGDGGMGGGGGTGGSIDLCEGVTCEDTECKSNGVCDANGGVCDFTLAEDGTVCSEGECLDGVCAPAGAFSCTEQGIRDAIAEGGGPHFFACDGPTTVVTGERIDIDNDVILDGEGKLTLDGNGEHRVLFVVGGATVEVHGFTITGGANGGVANGGELTLVNCTVSGNINGSGITNAPFGAVKPGVLTVKNSTVSANTSAVYNLRGTTTLTNTTLSGNRRMTLPNGYEDETVSNIGGEVILNSSTVVGTIIAEGGMIISTATIVDGDCRAKGSVPGEWVSNGYNVHTGDGWCGFGEETDRDVDPNDLKLGPLQNNGGPTMTHALLPGSPALDRIPAVDCEVDTDQRGEPRPETDGTMCDVGAFEAQP